MPLNKVTIQGNILHDLALKGTEGKEVINFLIGVNENFKKEGEQYPKSYTFTTKAFGHTAKFIHNNFKKLDQIIIEGTLVVDDPYTKENGEQVPSQVSIKVDQAYFAGRKESGSADTQKKSAAAPHATISEPSNTAAAAKPVRSASPFARK